MAVIRRLRYIGPIDAVEVPGVGRVVRDATDLETGPEFECGNALADSLLEQGENFEAVDTTTVKGK